MMITTSDDAYLLIAACSSCCHHRQCAAYSSTMVQPPTPRHPKEKPRGAVDVLGRSARSVFWYLHCHTNSSVSVVSSARLGVMQRCGRRGRVSHPLMLSKLSFGHKDITIEWTRIYIYSGISLDCDGSEMTYASFCFASTSFSRPSMVSAE